MKGKRAFIGGVLAVLMLLLMVGPGQTQGPGPQGEVSVQGTVGTAFTYQGQLKKDGASVSGTCDMQFSLWNAASGGTQVGTTQTKTNVAVSRGLFTVQVDFGGSAFQGDARWLGVAVRCPAGSGSYTTLSPRQALTAAPYALGLRPGAVISDANSSVEANRYVSGTLDRRYGVYAKAQGAHYNVGVYGEANGSNDVGVAGYSSSGWGVYGESAHAAGYGVFGFNGSGAGVYGRTDSGRGVYGEATATAGYGVYAENPNGTAIYAVGRNAVVGMSSTPNYAAVFGRNTASTGEGYGVYGRSDSTNGNGVYGVATATSGANFGVVGVASSTNGYGVFGYSSSNAVPLAAKGRNNNLIEAWREWVDQAGTWAACQFWVTLGGHVYASGFHSPGADLAEMFPAAAGLEPGDVLVVESDGQLTRSSTAYQPTVVGVYSTNPGFVGGSSGDADTAGKIPLAIGGIVPVKASTENGPIQPGDLLVASSTPGHAMKAGPNPATGTVIGKALGSLESGTGVIQMLVMLR
ncbi:MAG: hypothetical protein Kow00123_15630 [Anaerolineales bacterium]